MQIEKEQDILDPAIRKKILAEIRGDENQKRKREHFKRYQCLKDQTWRYVVNQLLRQFDESTVNEMAYSISNLSLAKKAIEKLARVYSFGVKRTAVDLEGQEDIETTEEIQELTKLLDFNTKMKSLNRLLKLSKNCKAYPKMYPTYENGQQLWDLRVEIMPPFLYDVVEDKNCREKDLCVILSNYVDENPVKYSLVDAAVVGRSASSLTNTSQGNKVDELIADTPSDKDAQKKEFIWWSNSYHFTTNEAGEIISENQDNPIGVLPLVNFAIDQDGAFWAQGGDDLVDGSIMLNSLISNLNHISIVQGYGQFFMKGENLPTMIKIGPNKAIRLEYNKEMVVPDLGFVTANPPLAEIRSVIEMYVALLLTTNNLSTTGISATLNSTNNPASGVALVLDKAESMEDVQDQAQIFHDNEPQIWNVIAKWLTLFEASGALVDRLKGFKFPDQFRVELKFGDPKPIMSEQEKLDNIQKRKDIGLNTQAELLMIDDPSLTEEQAKERLAKISEEKMKRLIDATGNVIKGNQNESNPSNGQPIEDDQQPGPGSSGADEESTGGS